MKPGCAPLLSLLLAAGCLLWPAGARGEGDWLHWRGPRYSGAAAVAGLPERWSRTENIAWSTRLPGKGASTPIVAGGRIYLTAEDRGQTLFALAVDRAFGAILWMRPLGKGRDLTLNTSAAPSPVTDGKRVFFLFGNGVLAATDPDGKILWQRDLGTEYGPFEVRFGYSSSPLLCEGLLFVAVIQGDPQHQEPTETDPAMAGYLLAVAPETGRTVWKRARPSDAEGEAQEAYSSTTPRKGPHGTEIVLVGGDCVTGHDPRTGSERWRWKGYNPSRHPVGRVVPSPVMVEDLVIVTAPRHEGAYAIRPRTTGVKPGVGVAWVLDGGGDVATPLYYDGWLYVLDGDEKFLAAVDVRTGEVPWIGDLPSKGVFRASPTGADGRIYCIDEYGEVFVLKAGNEFELLARINMGGRDCFSSIVAADKDLFVRTGDELHCIRDMGR